MPFANSARNDVFISYAHADNEAGPSGVKWVSEFAKYLDVSLKQRLGCGDSLRVYLDNRDLSANRPLDELLDEVRNSAVFVAISSPSYVQREWTRKELDAFAQIDSTCDRLFAIEMLPLDSLDDYPSPLDSKPRARFWQLPDADSRTPLPLDPRLDLQIYTQRLLDLAEQVRKRLLDFNTALAHPVPAAAPAPSGGSIGKILLAQATDELEFEREQLKSYLQQMNVSVLPEGDYPQGGESFKQAFRSDLAEADIFVQLLGKAGGRKPPDLPEGYIQTQFSLATEAGKTMLLWRHPELDVENIPDPVHQHLLTSDTVVASGLESFKSDVIGALEAMKAPVRDTPSSLIYVGAERADLPVAREVSEALRAHNYPVVIPTFDGSSEEIRQDLEDSLLESDSVIFVHGSAPVTWIRGNLRRLHKLMSLRKNPPQKVAIFTAPPPKEGDIGVSLPYVETVDSSETLDVDTLLDLLEKGR